MKRERRRERKRERERWFRSHSYALLGRFMQTTRNWDIHQGLEITQTDPPDYKCA